MNFQEFYEKDEQRLSLVDKTINAFEEGNEPEFKNLATKVFKEKELTIEFSKKLENEINKMLMLDSKTLNTLFDFTSNISGYGFNPISFFNVVLNQSALNLKRFVIYVTDLFKHPFYNKQLIKSFDLMDTHNHFNLDMLKIFIDRAVELNHLTKDNVENVFRSIKLSINKVLLEELINYTNKKYPQLLIKFTNFSYALKKGDS